MGSGGRVVWRVWGLSVGTAATLLRGGDWVLGVGRFSTRGVDEVLGDGTNPRIFWKRFLRVAGTGE